ncbi:MAG: flavodoxin family protein [Pseudomonadales bacterium]
MAITSKTLNKLLIVYHSKNGNTARMAQAVLAGAGHEDIAVDVRFRLAREAGVDDLLWCDGIILGTPENFGYMSGAMKDFFDRTYYPAEGKLEGLPYAVFINAGNDGQGALRSIERIVTGFAFKQVHDPVIVIGDLDESKLNQCEELGMFMAAGVEARLF